MTSTLSRPLYRAEQLNRLFAPRSIAVVGASPNPGSFGAVTCANIAAKGGYQGLLYRVNARYNQIGDQPCYPSIAALPETPDCVFVAVPRDAVEAVVKQGVKQGTDPNGTYLSAKQLKQMHSLFPRMRESCAREGA